MKSYLLLGLSGLMLSGCFSDAETTNGNEEDSEENLEEHTLDEEIDQEEEGTGGSPDSLPPLVMSEDEASEVLQQAIDVHEGLSSVWMEQVYSVDEGVPRVNEPIVKQYSVIEWVRGESLLIERENEERNALNLPSVYLDQAYRYQREEEEWKWWSRSRKRNSNKWKHLLILFLS